MVLAGAELVEGMKITPSPKEPRVHNADYPRLLSAFQSQKSLHARLGPAVQQRGYIYGLFHGRYDCPVKEGVLRHWWLNGCCDGMRDRNKASKP